MIIVTAATTAVLILALWLILHELGRAGRLTVYAWAIMGIGVLYGPVSAFVYLQSVSGVNAYWAPYIPNDGISYLAHPLAAMLLRSRGRGTNNRSCAGEDKGDLQSGGYS